MKCQNNEKSKQDSILFPPTILNENLKETGKNCHLSFIQKCRETDFPVNIFMSSLTGHNTMTRQQ